MTQILPTVHIIDDEVDLADQLAKILKSLNLTAATYSSPIDFLGKYVPGNPGCIVTDIRMPGMSGTDLQDRILALNDSIPIIFISGCADVPTTVRVMSKGARYLFEKGSSTHELVDAIQKALADDQATRSSSSMQADILNRFASLSSRERDILQGMIKGLTNKEMGEVYGISSNTVEIHRARVKTKMQADTLADLIRMSLIYKLEGR